MRVLALLLATLCLAAQPSGDSGALRIRVVESSGPVHIVGSRSAAALVVEVTGADGKPIQDARVAFRLPASGPGGMFSNGLASDVAVTGADGRASAPSVRWNRVPGPLEIRITAAKDSLRGSAVSTHRLLPSAADSPTASFSSGRSRKKLLLILAGVAAGSTAAGLAAVRRPSGSGVASTPAVTVTVGVPTITIGGPQ